MKAGIVGAGIMGQLLALNLLNTGWDVTLFDHNDGINCSMAAAGLLTPISELVKNDLVVCDLGIQGITQHWPLIIEQLQQPIYFQNKGSLLVAHPHDQAELIPFINSIRRKLQYSPHASQQHIKAINPSELEPELTKTNQGYYFAAEGCLDNQNLLKELQNYLFKQVTWHKKTTVEKITDGKIITTQTNQSFDMVFDCRGLAAKNSFETLRGVRGELVWLQAPEVNIQRPVRLLHPRYSLYIVPRANATYILGASELEMEDNSAISVQTLLELLTSAYWLHPGFAEARLIKTVTHCRPTLPDQLPKIKYSNQLIAVNGLYRHGFLIAPALAADIVLFLHSGISTVNYPSLWEQTHDSSAI